MRETYEEMVAVHLRDVAAQGDFWAHIIDVTEADEPAVREWLTGRAKTITAIWAPIALAPAEVTA